MADVRLTGITKAWGAAAAVEDISFSAPAGHLVALLGPSGCGKSTTLRLIAGLETASAGTIRIADRDVTALPPARRGVSMVFQSYALLLAAGELRGLAVEQRLQPEDAGGALQACIALGLRHIAHLQAEQDVLGDRKMRKQRV